MSSGGNNFNYFPENQLTKFKLCPLPNFLIPPRISVTHFASPRARGCPERSWPPRKPASGLAWGVTPKFLGEPNPSLHLVSPFVPFTFSFPFFPLPLFLRLEADPSNKARGLESAVSSSSGVWGGAPAESEFGAF